MPTLTVTLDTLTFSSPLLNASGTFYPETFHALTPLQTVLGGIVTKTVTPQPMHGNPQPRTVELPGIGMLNSIGLQNPGLTHWLDTEAKQYQSYQLPVILSISANSIHDFQHMAQQILTHANSDIVSALELNLSCPNVSQGGIHFGSQADSVFSVLQAIKTVWPKPVFAKLTPNVRDITEIGHAAVEGGADALTAINTVLGMAIDITERKPILPRVSGGYSGPGIQPIALHAIWKLHQALPHTPLIAVGGIQTLNDVLAFIMAGASLVQIGTSCFRNPLVFAECHTQLQQWMTEHGVATLDELRGCAHRASQTIASPC